MVGLVPLIDLLNGEYYKRKAEEKKLKNSKIEKLKMQRKQQKLMEENEELKYESNTIFTHVY